jgi:hypothetical protein
MKNTSRCSFDETLAARIARLRDLLITGEELATASEYFHEALVPDETFLGASASDENPRLLSILGGVLNAAAPGGELASPMMLRIEKFSLWHGCAFWRRGIALFFYFEELDLGLCSYQRSLADPSVRFMRFSVSRAESDWGPSRQRGCA